MTLALVLVLCAGAVTLAVFVGCRGRRHHRGYRWSADDQVRQAMSSTSMDRRHQ